MIPTGVLVTKAPPASDESAHGPSEDYRALWEGRFHRLDALLGEQVTDHLRRQAVRRLEVVQTGRRRRWSSRELHR